MVFIDILVLKIISYLKNPSLWKGLVILQLRWWALGPLRHLHCLSQTWLIKSVLRDILLPITGHVSWFCKLLLWLFWLKRALQCHLCLLTWSDSFCKSHKLQKIQIRVFIIAIYNILILCISLAYFIREFFRL